MSASRPSALDVGSVLVGAARTITEAEISFLPALMGAISPLFHDEETARSTAMGGRILYGPALLGISIAGTEAFLRDQVLGLLELTDVRFRRPVRPGDTITPTMEIVDRAPRDGRPGVVLVVRDEVHNQSGDLVLAFTRRILIAG